MYRSLDEEFVLTPNYHYLCISWPNCNGHHFDDRLVPLD